MTKYTILSFTVIMFIFIIIIPLYICKFNPLFLIGVLFGTLLTSWLSMIVFPYILQDSVIKNKVTKMYLKLYQEK